MHIHIHTHTHNEDFMDTNEDDIWTKENNNIGDV